MICVSTCKECTEAGENFKPIKFQAHYVKLSRVENVNDEVSIGFAGQFKIAKSTKKYLTVSFDSKSGWLEAKFSGKKNTAAVLEFLNNYIALFGIPKRTRRDPGSPFMSEKISTVLSGEIH